jgi:hypothetical protein
VRLDDGILVAHRTTENLKVAVYRIPSGGVLCAPAAIRTGVVLNLGAGSVALDLGGDDQIASPGQHLPLPASRRWRLTNLGDDTATVAHVHHVWSTGGRS